jgi:small conductance mechanosensitive channel
MDRFPALPIPRSKWLPTALLCLCAMFLLGQESLAASASVRTSAQQGAAEAATLLIAQAAVQPLSAAASDSKLGKMVDDAVEADPVEKDLWRHNPFTLDNVQSFISEHGRNLLVILIGYVALRFVVKIGTRRLAQALARTSGRGTALDRENRVITLVGVFRNTATVLLVTGTVLMVLDELGVSIGPLMGGAAVLGLAVAFGAQNLIRDYFTGFMVLLEDQYGVNDVVKIGDASGAVEKITLRMTVLRDLEGSLHFIPHGTITQVTNMTHGWSRAVVDVGVAYNENPDRAMSALLEIGKELRNDPKFSPLILDGPEMLGVDALGDSAVTIKFFLKTQPSQRWFVKRELLRRIKKRFDELDIEIPFPQRTIHYARDEGDSTAPPDTGDTAEG